VRGNGKVLRLTFQYELAALGGRDERIDDDGIEL
jgi:hypothetical protein